MDIERFAAARDSLYAAALFLGAGTGCILHYIRRRIAIRRRNMSLTLGLCFFSAATAALSAALVFSRGVIRPESALCIPLGIAAALTVLAFRFPRAASFPFVLVCGGAVVWIVFAFPRLLPGGGSGAFVVGRERGGLVSLAPLHEAPLPVENGPEPPLKFQPSREDSFLEFHAVSFSCSRFVPVIGGKGRGFVTEILNGGEVLFAGPRPGERSSAAGPLDKIRNRLIVRGEVSGRLELDELFPGSARIVRFDGSDLVIR